MEEKHTENFDGKKIEIVSVVNFFLGFSLSLVAYIASFYYQQAAHSDNVSIFYFVPFLLIFFSLLRLHRVVRALGKSFLIIALLFAQILTLCGLLFADLSLQGALLLMVFHLIYGLLWVVLDETIESFSTDRKSGRIHGIYLTALNLGILLGPFASTQLLQYYGFRGVFLTLLAIYCATFLFATFTLRAIPRATATKDISLRFLGGTLFANANMRNIYWVALTLDFFYALMNIYTPLYLLEKGLSWGQIGFVFTVMLIPFVLIQYPVGFLADKKWGERELLFVAFVLMGVSALLMTGVDASHILLWSLILLLGRIGAALVEILRDSYFYKQVDGADVGLINLYRTSRSLAYVIAAIVGVAMLTVFPLGAIFFVIAGVAFLGLYPTWKLVDSQVEEEMLV